MNKKNERKCKILIIKLWIVLVLSPARLSVCSSSRLSVCQLLCTPESQKRSRRKKYTQCVQFLIVASFNSRRVQALPLPILPILIMISFWSQLCVAFCFHCSFALILSLSHSPCDFPLLLVCFWQLCEYVLWVCLWRNLINFTWLEQSRVDCQKVFKW